MQETKPYSISKRAVITAYERVKANKGTYGVDEQSIEDFEGVERQIIALTNCITRSKYSYKIKIT